MSFRFPNARAHRPQNFLTKSLRRRLNRDASAYADLARRNGYPSTKKRAAEICHGEDNCNLTKIKGILNNEHLYFHDWIRDPEGQISICLYPLKREDLKYIELDDAAEVAAITLSRKGNKKIDSIDSSNIELCEKLTGYKIEIL